MNSLFKDSCKALIYINYHFRDGSIINSVVKPNDIWTAQKVTSGQGLVDSKNGMPIHQRASDSSCSHSQAHSHLAGIYLNRCTNQTWKEA